MIRINLLPHREARRKQNKSAFYAMLVLAGLIGLIAVGLVGAVLQTKLEIQNQRNRVIKEANAELDTKIAEISKLKQEIEALKARQQAVEDLQSDRNQPVYLMDELVKQTPEGVYLKGFRQEGQKITLNGYAQSNERVSELLRNLSNSSEWLERPDLQEIRLASIGSGKAAKKVYEFGMVVGIKRQRDKDQAAKDQAANGEAGKAGTNAVSASAKVH